MWKMRIFIPMIKVNCIDRDNRYIHPYIPDPRVITLDAFTSEALAFRMLVYETLKSPYTISETGLEKRFKEESVERILELFPQWIEKYRRDEFDVGDHISYFEKRWLLGYYEGKRDQTAGKYFNLRGLVYEFHEFCSIDCDDEGYAAADGGEIIKFEIEIVEKELNTARDEGEDVVLM